MKCVILCAGYATRLYPLTQNTPKPLLKITGKTIVEYILDQLQEDQIDHIYLVTNNKFYQNFTQWYENLGCDRPLTIINDHTLSNEDRLGSIGDLNYVITETKFNDDFLVINGDNLFNFSIIPVLTKFKEGRTTVALYDVKTLEEARKMGIPTLDANGIITDLVEKPKNPKTTLVVIGIYCFRQEVIALLQQYILAGNSTDKVGEFLEWLHKKVEISTYHYNDPGAIWLDIGTYSQLELANQLFANL